MVPTELVPTCLRLKPDADGRDSPVLFSVGRELRKSSFQVLVTLRAPGYREERVRPVRFGGTGLQQSCLVVQHPAGRVTGFPPPSNVTVSLEISHRKAYPQTMSRDAWARGAFQPSTCGLAENSSTLEKTRARLYQSRRVASQHLVDAVCIDECPIWRTGRAHQTKDVQLQGCDVLDFHRSVDRC
jgi:hypothetical protein